MPIPKFSDIEAAYLAGIIDGEGSVYIAKHKEYSGRGLPYSYSTRVSVGNTDERLINWIQKTVKTGNIHFVQETRNNWKDHWHWLLADKNITPFLEQILPFLIIKKEQALILLRFRELIDKSRTYPGKCLSSQEVVSRQ